VKAPPADDYGSGSESSETVVNESVVRPTGPARISALLERGPVVPPQSKPSLSARVKGPPKHEDFRPPSRNKNNNVGHAPTGLGNAFQMTAVATDPDESYASTSGSSSKKAGQANQPTPSLGSEIHDFQGKTGRDKPRVSGELRAWEQAGVDKLPMILNSTTSTSQHLDLSDNSYADTSVSSYESDMGTHADSQRLERIEGMIKELGARREEPRA
jgi:hypothetical protein